MGSVHMGVGVCYLDPQGVIHPHLHSFEESFYILEGTATLQTGAETRELGTVLEAILSATSSLKAAAVPASATWMELEAIASACTKGRGALKGL